MPRAGVRSLARGRRLRGGLFLLAVAALAGGAHAQSISFNVFIHDTTTLRLNWAQSGVSGIANYVVTWRGAPNGNSGDLANNLHTYDIKGLTKGNTYTIQVEALLTAGGSVVSDRQTKQLELQAPRNVRATPTSPTTVRVSWDYEIDPDQYLVLWRPVGGDLTRIDSISRTATSHDIGNLTPGTTYEFQPRAEKSGFGEIFGGFVSATPDYLVAPTGLVAEVVSPTSLTVRWNAVADAENYVVAWKGPGQELGDDGQSQRISASRTSYTIVGLTTDAAYTVRVSAERSGFPTVASEVTGTPTALGKPTNLLVTVASPTSLDVAWDAVPDAESYDVRWKGPGQGFHSSRTETGVTATSHTISDLTPETRYTVQVVANRAGFPSTESDEVVQTTSSPLTKPTGVQVAVASATSLRVTWDAVSDADSYTVRWKGPGQGFDASRTETGITETSYTIAGLTPATRYTVQVVANRSGFTPQESDEVSQTTRPQASLTATSIADVSADLEIANHTGDWWYRRTAPTRESCTAATSSTVALTGLTASTDYTYAAYADSSCADELASEEFRTLAPIPMLTAGGVGADGATLTLANHTGNWWYRQVSPAVRACTAAPAGGAATLAGLDAGFDYRYAAYSDSFCSTELAQVEFKTEAKPDIAVTGDGRDIANGDMSPGAQDGTDFGPVPVSQGTQERTFTIANAGTLLLTLSGSPDRVAVKGANASDFSVSAQPGATVSLNGTTTFTVAFDPSDAGTRTATLSIASDDPDENPFEFAVHGTGTAPEIVVEGDGRDIANGDTVPAPRDGTDFGSVPVVEGSEERTFTIGNTGTLDLTLTGAPNRVSVRGRNASDFTVSAQPVDTVARGETTTFKVVFDPSATGTRMATISIPSDDLDENPFTFAVAGEGKTNRRPSFASQPTDGAAVEGSEFSYEAPAATDPDDDAIAYAATLADGGPLPRWLAFDAGTREFSGTPDEDDAPATLRIRVTATDDGVPPLSATADFTLTVRRANRPPAFPDGLPDATAIGKVAFRYEVPAATDPDGNRLTYTVALASGGPLPGWLGFDAATRTLSGTPGAGDGPTSLRIRVTVTDDGEPSLEGTADFTLTVEAANQAPVFSTQPTDAMVTEGSGWSYEAPAATDPDNDTLAYTATLTDGSALPGWLDFDAETRTFSGTPRETDSPAVLRIQMLATDDGTPPLGATATFTLTVKRLNRPPAFSTPLADATAVEEVAFRYRVPAATDPEGHTLTYAASLADDEALPEWLGFDAATRTFSGTPAEEDVGVTLRIRVTVTDDGEPPQTVTAEFTLEARPTPTPPSADAGPDLEAGRGAEVTLEGLGTPHEEGSRDLAYEWRIVGASHEELAAADRLLSETEGALATYDVPYGADLADAGAAADGQWIEFELVVTDGDGDTAADRMRVTIRGTFHVVLTVLDASGGEADGVVEFPVTLEPAARYEVSVDFATADGTAVAGADYAAMQGTLSFLPGETRQTVTVRVHEDERDEGTETFALTLSNPRPLPLASFADPADVTATGTITDADPLLDAWLARFGRSVAAQTVDAVSGRLARAARESSHVTVGGRRFAMDGSGAADAASPTGRGGWRRRPDDPWADRDAWQPFGADAGARPLTARELLPNSSFHLTSRRRDGFQWAGWGRAGFDSFRSRDGGTPVDGEVLTGVVGADLSSGPWLAGVAVSFSGGSGAVAPRGQAAEYDIESGLTAVNPYLMLRLSDRVSAWGLAGWGRGDITLEGGGAMSSADGLPASGETDITMRLAAFGGRADVLSPARNSGFGLALLGDGFFVRTESDALGIAGLGRLDGADARARRLRLGVEGSFEVALGQGAALTPSLEVSFRHDDGDAEAGGGVEVGGGLAWSRPASRFSAELRARTLVTHAEAGYREWGVSGTLNVAPRASGRGVSLSVVPAWGAHAGLADRLWNARDAGQLVRGIGAVPSARLDAELGYGLPGIRYTGLVTPYVGVSLGAGHREWRGGARVRMGALEGTLTLARAEPAFGAPDHRVRVDVRVPLGDPAARSTPLPLPALGDRGGPATPPAGAPPPPEALDWVRLDAAGTSPPGMSPPGPAPIPPASPGWRVQLGAFASAAAAARARTALARKLPDTAPARPLVVDDGRGDGLHRVMLAAVFGLRDEADAACAAVAARGATCFVAGGPERRAARAGSRP